MREIKFILFLVAFIFSNAQVSAFYKPIDHQNHFLTPRDYNIFYVTEIDQPFHSASRLLSLKKSCKKNPKAYYYCDYIKKISSNNFYSEFDLLDIIDSETNILFFGEIHIDQFPKDYLRDNLSLLKNQGFTTLALEMFNSKSQHYLDAYLKNIISSRSLKKVLENEWYYKKDYMSLIKEAKKLKMSIIALDDRKSFTDLSDSKQLQMRDKHWAKVIETYISKNPTEKIVALSGKMHAFQSFSKKDININTVGELLYESINAKFQSIHLTSSKFSRIYMNLYRDEIEDTKKEKTILYTGEELAPYISAIILQN